MIRFFVGHPTAANLLMIGIMVLGLSALPDLERETFPDIPLSNVQVQVINPGASAEESRTPSAAGSRMRLTASTT